MVRSWRHRWAKVPTWSIWIATVLFLILAIWFAWGPWSVHSGAMSLGCGSPFDGGYSGRPDMGAGLYYQCELQAGHRELATYVFSGLCLLSFIVACVRTGTDEGTAVLARMEREGERVH